MAGLFFSKRTKRGHGAVRKVERKSKAVSQHWVLLKKIIIGVLLVGVLGLLGINSKTLIEDINQQRIRYVMIEGNLSNVTEDDIKSTVFDFINQSMVAVDLPAVKLALEQNAWINSVNLRRKWPDILIIDVTEEVAIARWGEKDLLNQEAALFSPPVILAQQNLASLSGPEGSEKMVMQQYQVFNQVLSPTNLRIKSLHVNSRGAWFLQLNNEVRLVIGSVQPIERLQRFATVFGRIFADQIDGIESFDLRYEDGIAVKHKNVIQEDNLLSMQG